MTSPEYLSYIQLYAAHNEKRILDIVKNKCIAEEAENLDEILKSWQLAKESLKQIEEQDSGAADNCEISDLTSPLIEQIKKNPSIRNTFSKYNIDFKMVELDNMIAVQRQVLLNHAEKIAQNIPENPTEDDLIRFCLIPGKEVPISKPERNNAKSWTFSSPNKDFRFLGGFLKKRVTTDDYELTNVGGVPTHALVLFVGYGIDCMNAFSINNRIILTNGFHRAYALRKKGIKKIPLLLKIITNTDSFKDRVKGLKKEYLLNHQRPVLIKDFFNDDLVRIFKRKPTNTVVNISWDSKKENIG